METCKPNRIVNLQVVSGGLNRTNFQRHVAFLMLMTFLVFSVSPNAAIAQVKKLEFDACTQCKLTINQRIAELQEIKKQLDKSYITDKNLALLIKWKERFKIDIKRCKLEDEIVGLSAGTGTSILGNLLVSMELTVAGAGLASTGYAVLIYYIGVEYYNAIYNISSWKIIDQNTAIYQWLVDYLEYGRTNKLDKNTIGFLFDNQKAVEAITGKKLPARSDKKAIESYLKTYAVLLFYTIGQIEEKFGSTKFPRFKINDLTGKYKGSRYDAGYYRYVLTSVLTSEIDLAIKELSKLKGKDCNKKAHTLINRGTLKEKPAVDKTITKGTAVKPINKLKPGAPDDGVKKLDKSKTDKTQTTLPR